MSEQYNSRDVQLFSINEKIFKTVNLKDVLETFKQMNSLDLVYPPFEIFDIRYSIEEHEMQKWICGDINEYNAEMVFPNDESKKIIQEQKNSKYFRYFWNKETEIVSSKWAIYVEDKKEYRDFDDPEILRRMLIGYKKTKIFDEYKYSENEFFEIIVNQFTRVSAAMFALLIVLLATKNIKKTVEEIKKHGPKSKKRPREYRYITTLNVGKITETARLSGSSGSSVRPHLRRGHVRNQHCGLKRKEIKQIFIQPVFVNADKEWIENQRKEYIVKM